LGSYRKSQSEKKSENNMLSLANNVETPDTCTGEMKEPCFTCDYCKHYDGKGTDRRLQDCDKYIVTDEHARRLRRHMKIINRRKAHQ